MPFPVRHGVHGCFDGLPDGFLGMAILQVGSCYLFSLRRSLPAVLCDLHADIFVVRFYALNRIRGERGCCSFIQSRFEDWTLSHYFFIKILFIRICLDFQTGRSGFPDRWFWISRLVPVAFSRLVACLDFQTGFSRRHAIVRMFLCPFFRRQNVVLSRCV